MRKFKLLVLFLSNSLMVLGQNTPIYTWQQHLSFSNAKIIIEVENDIYCATENGIFTYNKYDYTISRLNKINGLSDVGVSSMCYDHENKIIIIFYNNTNIDLIKNNNVVNIPDVKNKLILGEKKYTILL